MKCKLNYLEIGYISKYYNDKDNKDENELCRFCGEIKDLNHFIFKYNEYKNGKII